jgi:hypothetical protein
MTSRARGAQTYRALGAARSRGQPFAEVLLPLPVGCLPADPCCGATSGGGSISGMGSGGFSSRSSGSEDRARTRALECYALTWTQLIDSALRTVAPSATGAIDSLRTMAPSAAGAIDSPVAAVGAAARAGSEGAQSPVLAALAFWRGRARALGSVLAQLEAPQVVRPGP